MSNTGNLREFYRDNSYATLGEQYNNLGNVIQGESGVWPGQKGIGWSANNRAFKCFESVADGVAAQAFVVDRIVNAKGARNFYDMLAIYAPKNDGNNVDVYASYLASHVDPIARKLGYEGPPITATTDLKAAFDGPYGDQILAATLKAMNVREVGEEASNRLGSASVLLDAVKNKYRKLGGYAGYSKLLGKAPIVVAPNRKHTGYTDDNGVYHAPTDGDIDDVTKDMFSALLDGLKKLFDMLGGIFGGLLSGKSDPATASAPSLAPAGELDITKLVSADLLKKLGDNAALNFDVDYNGHLTQQDVVIIKAKLQTGGVTVASNADTSQILTAYANQLIKAQQTQNPQTQR